MIFLVLVHSRKLTLNPKVSLQYTGDGSMKFDRKPLGRGKKINKTLKTLIP